MNQKKVNRFGHAGKSYHEKEAYKKFIASNFSLDKTEEDPVDIAKTNESSFEEEKVEPTKVKKKSRWLKVKDLLYDNWFVTIVGGLIVGVFMLGVSGYISINREQGIQGEKISTIEKDIGELKKGSGGFSENYNSLKESFNIFKAEVTKDIEFIKLKIGL